MKFEVTSEQELIKIIPSFLSLMETHTVFALRGEMGVGKTTFISYLAKAMGVNEGIGSPTYGYVNEYETQNGEVIYHFDLYRLENEEEAYDIGIEEYLYDDKIVFIEWAEKIENLLPENCVWVNMKIMNHGVREIEIEV